MHVDTHTLTHAPNTKTAPWHLMIRLHKAGNQEKALEAAGVKMICIGDKDKEGGFLLGNNSR